MSIYSLWNPENDEAIFSPGDQQPFCTLTLVDSDKHKKKLTKHLNMNCTGPY